MKIKFIFTFLFIIFISNSNFIKANYFSKVGEFVSKVVNGDWKMGDIVDTKKYKEVYYSVTNFISTLTGQLQNMSSNANDKIKESLQTVLNTIVNTHPDNQETDETKKSFFEYFDFLNFHSQFDSKLFLNGIF